MSRARPRRRSASITTITTITLAMVILVGCGGGGGGGDDVVVLDGSPRVPDDAGIVEELAADFSTITLEGGQRYELSDELQSFSTYDLATVPVRQRIGQYVQLGLDGDTVVWIAGISTPVELDGEQTTFYVGTVVAVDDRVVSFVDGTVLELDDGVSVPGGGGVLQAEIDPTRNVVTALVPA